MCLNKGNTQIFATARKIYIYILNVLNTVLSPSFLCWKENKGRCRWISLWVEQSASDFVLDICQQRVDSP